MKTKSIVKKYEKLSSEYGKAVSKWVESKLEYENHPTGENKQLEEDAYTELVSSRIRLYSFVDQEWR